MLVHTLWQTAMLSGRVLAIVVFASHFKAWTFLVLGNVCIFQNNNFNLISDKHFKDIFGHKLFTNREKNPYILLIFKKILIQALNEIIIV